MDPRIAILIPAHNEGITIKGTIQALLSAGVERKDLFIVDDQSTDDTASIARSTGVRVFTTPVNCGKALAQRAALNAKVSGFRIMENYDWVIFLDGDTMVDLQFMNVMFEAANTADPNTGLFVGQVRSTRDTHLYSAARAFDYTFGHDIAKGGQSNFNVVYVAPGCASMYRTDLLSQLEIDHKTLAEDMDLTIQVHRAGKRVQFVSHAVVNTQDPATLRDYHKQSLRWSRGFWQVMLKHGCFLPRHRVDWYMLLLALDGLIFNKAAWLAAVGWYSLKGLAFVFAADVALTFAIALWCGYRTKRADVVYKMPAYYWLGYLQLYVWVRAFIEIVVLRKEILAWNKVQRYDFGAV